MSVQWFLGNDLSGWTGHLGRSIGLIFCLLFLSGCVRDDMTLRFADANHGQWEQRIRLERQVMTSIGRSVAIAYLNTLEERAKELGGRTQHLSERELSIQIPFFNATDLQTKFNAFFQGESSEQRSIRSSRKLANLTGVPSHLQIWTKNLIVSQRYHLIYDLDLRSLQTLFAAVDRSRLTAKNLTAKDQAAIDPKTFLSLTLTLITPKDAQVPAEVATLTPTLRQRDRQLTWQLQPGELNHLEATFWVPSALGRGFIAIALLVVGGAIVKILRTPAIAFVDHEDAEG